MQKIWHRLTLGGVLSALSSVVVSTFDPSLVSSHTAGIIGIVGSVVGLVSHVLHANAAEQAVIDAVSGIANRTITGK
jgi:hypothetical protein